MPLKKARYATSCAFCGTEVSHLKRHTIRNHVPWYMSPAVACASCQIASDPPELRRFHGGHGRVKGEDQLRAWFLLVNGLMLFISSCLGLGSLEALLGLVVEKQLASSSAHTFLEDEEFFLREYDQLAGLEPKPKYDVCPPTRTSELLHYHTLTQIFLQLTPDQRTEAWHYSVYCNPDGSSPPLGHPVFKYHIIDGHFHLDQLTGGSSRSLRELEVQAKSDITLVHAIANFVFPYKWGTISKLVELDSRISFTLGVHPHFIYRNTVDFEFNRLVRMFEKHPTAVAVGEVGLDFTTACRCKAAHNREKCKEGKIEGQHRFLEKTLKLADQLGKPVVIHCRDDGDGTAAKGVLQSFVTLNLTHLKVQRHCFIGDFQELESWSSTLPNCLFSLSRESVTDKRTRKALVLADHRKLLLETDSPYLAFDGDTGHGPWRVGKVAQAASSIMGVPVPELVRSSNSNLAKLFNIKW